LIARRTHLTTVAARRSARSANRSSSTQCLALLLLSGTSVLAGCYLTLDSDELDAKSAGVVVDAGPGAADSLGFTTSLDTPPIELPDDKFTRDPCVATTLQAREILTTNWADAEFTKGIRAPRTNNAAAGLVNQRQC